MAQGKFIVIEGTDGSGKSEQTKRLMARLQQDGFLVNQIHFPQHGQSSSWFVDEYLNGRLGSLDEINPRTASLFYALDRFAAAPEIREALIEGKIMLADRYVGSNMGHQGGKFKNARERAAYFLWNYELEYEINRIPKPDLNIVLLVPPVTAQRLLDQKQTAGREYLNGKKLDIHEADLAHLNGAYDSYVNLTQVFREDFIALNCMDEDGCLMPIETIHNEIWHLVTSKLQLGRASHA